MLDRTRPKVSKKASTVRTHTPFRVKPRRAARVEIDIDDLGCRSTPRPSMVNRTGHPGVVGEEIVLDLGEHDEPTRPAGEGTSTPTRRGSDRG